MIRIGLDAIPLLKLHGGVSYYIFFLLDDLIKLRPNDLFFLFVDRDGGDVQYFKKYPNVRISKFPPKVLGHSIWSQTGLALGCLLNKIDVFWATTQSIPLLKSPKMKCILTLYDFVYLICPETMSAYRKIYLKLFSKWMLRLADAILPISKGSGLKLEQFYNLNYHTVIHPPLKPLLTFREHISEFLKSHSLEKKQYLVTIGTFEPRKNFLALLDVYLQILKENPEDTLPLVIIGAGGWKNEELLDRLNAAKKMYPKQFVHTGYANDNEIAQFLSGARYCILVSKYEGYGMPLSEAKMCGTNVICLDQTEMKEAADGNGIFLNENQWQTEIRPYMLASSETIPPSEPSYPTNKDKAEKISEIINSQLNRKATCQF